MKNLLFILLVILPSAVLAQNRGIIFGDEVYVHSGPGLDAKIINAVSTGQRYTIKGKTKKRDTLNKKHPHGYHWYRIRTISGKGGWVYGQHCYLLKSKEFYSTKGKGVLIENKKFMIGKSYYFRIAVEPAYPPMDSRGLTDSEVHAMPVFLRKKVSHALAIWMPEENMEKFIFRDYDDKNTWFRLKDNMGVKETVDAVTPVSYQNSKAVQIDIKYISQESKGAYRIVCLRENNRMVIKKFTITAGPGW